MRKPKLRGYGFRPSQTYSPKEIADRLGNAETTVREWIRDGKLPAVTNGNPHLVLGCDITAFFSDQRLKAPKLAVDEFPLHALPRPQKGLGRPCRHWFRSGSPRLLLPPSVRSAGGQCARALPCVICPA